MSSRKIVIFEDSKRSSFGSSPRVRNWLLESVKLVVGIGKVIIPTPTSLLESVLFFLKEPTKKEFVLEDLTVDAVNSILDYLRQGKIEQTFSNEQLKDFIKAAKAFELYGLVNTAIKELEITSANWIEMRQLGLETDSPELLKLVKIQVIRDALLNQTDEFLRFQVNEVENCIKKCSEREVQGQVLSAVVNWVSFDQNERKKYLPKLVQLVNLHHALEYSPHAFHQQFGEGTILHNTLECLQMYMKVVWESFSKSRSSTSVTSTSLDDQQPSTSTHYVGTEPLNGRVPLSAAADLMEQEQSNTIMPPFTGLPSVATKHILKYVADFRYDKFGFESDDDSEPESYSDKEEHRRRPILNCRLVCKQWNEIIENTSELMREITFYVNNLKKFLDLAIVKAGKVRSVRFGSKFKWNAKYQKKFLAAISKIEKVSFGCWQPQSNYALQLILQKCVNIQHLTIRYTQGNNGILNCLSDIEIVAATKVKIFTLKHFEDASNQITTELVKLINKLPRLEEINLLSDFNKESAAILEAGLREYFNKYKIGLRLKKLEIRSFYNNNNKVEEQELVTSFLILCGKYGVELVEPPRMNFNTLLSLIDSPSSLPSLRHRQQPLFTQKVTGKLTFETPDQALTTGHLDILRSLNVSHLNLKFLRDVVQEELGWINTLQGLESLKLANSKLADVYLTQTSIAAIDQILSAGCLTTVKQFHTDMIYEPVLINGLSRYFPTLQELTIENVDTSSDEMIQQLTALESLQSLSFHTLSNLRDASFTRQCKIHAFVTGANANGTCSIEFVPAIACFKSLQNIRIVSCKTLTNACIVNGISKSKTLKKLTIMNCSKISKDCENLVECEVNINASKILALLSPRRGHWG